MAAAVLERGPENSGERFTLFVLAFQADDLGFYAEEIKILQKDLSCSKETILRHLASLEKQGWLRIERRVLSGRSSVYFVNLEKLGVRVGATPYKHKLWADMERMKSVLDRGDKLSRRNGTLKFEKFADTGEIVASGDLFADENSGDNLTPENEEIFASNEGEKDDLEDFDAQTAENEGETGAPEVKHGPEDENSGDNLAPDRSGNSHLTGGNFQEPFNTSRKSRVFVSTTTPLTPVPGDRGDLILPKDDLRADDAEFPLAIAIAARWVMQKRGLSKRRLQEAIAQQLGLVCRQEEKTLQEAARFAVAQHEKYVADAPLLRWVYPDTSRIFANDFWRTLALWPYDQARMRAAGEAGIGMQKPADPAEWERRHRTAIAGYLKTVMALIERAGGFPAALERLAALRSQAVELDTEAIDKTLTELEAEMCEQVHAEATEDELRAVRTELEKKFAPYRGRMTDEQIAKEVAGRIGVELLYKRGLPRLGLFFMDSP